MEYCHLLFVQTLVRLKAQFQLPFCSHCTQLTGSTNESCPLVKFADDTELVGKISNDEDVLYHKQIEKLVNQCVKNYLYLNVSKTKEMCIDFRKNQRCPKPVYITEEAVERVETYKYLGMVFESKLNWKENITLC